MRFADERDHVVLAVGMQLDIAQHDDIIIARNFVEGAGQHVERALMIAGKKLIVGADHPLWGLAQAFARRIVAGIGYERADGLLRLLPRGASNSAAVSNL